jgi:hypothetical protein
MTDLSRIITQHPTRKPLFCTVKWTQHPLLPPFLCFVCLSAPKKSPGPPWLGKKKPGRRGGLQISEEYDESGARRYRRYQHWVMGPRALAVLLGASQHVKCSGKPCE